MKFSYEENQQGAHQLNRGSEGHIITQDDFDTLKEGNRADATAVVKKYFSDVSRQQMDELRKQVGGQPFQA